MLGPRPSAIKDMQAVPYICGSCRSIIYEVPCISCGSDYHITIDLSILIKGCRWAMEMYVVFNQKVKEFEKINGHTAVKPEELMRL